MNFVHPYFLFALAAIAIPIIIHLFNFRRYKTVHFTNVKFIEQIKQKTKKQSRLKELIILILRILAVASIVIAFAQPYIPIEDNVARHEASTLVSVYIDNSFSMQAKSKAGSLLEEAKKLAGELAMAYRQSDVFHLLTNDFDRKNQRLVSRDEFIEALDEISYSPAVRELSEVLSRQEDFLLDGDAENKVIFMVSDFQASIVKFDGYRADTNNRIFLLPVLAEQLNNIYIDSCWFGNPIHQVHQQSKLFIRIKNASAVDYEKIPVKLSINGTQKALASFDIAAWETSNVIIPFTHHEPGVKLGILEISDYPVTYDDVFYFSYAVQDLIPIMDIYDKLPNPFLYSFYNFDSAFLYTSIAEGNLNYHELQNYNLIFLDELPQISTGMTQELLQFVDKGGSLAVIPSTEIDLDSYRSFARRFNACTYGQLDTAASRVSYLNSGHSLFQDVFEDYPEQNQGRNIDLPVVMMHYPLKYPIPSLTEKLLSLGNGQDFLNVLSLGKGKLYLFASPVNPLFSNLPRHAIFVPILYKMALHSQPVFPDYYTIGSSNDRIEVRDQGLPGEQVYKVIKSGSEHVFIPEHRNLSDGVEIIMHDHIRDAGHYMLSEGERQIAMMAFNYDRRESDLSLLGEDAIRDQLSAAGIDNISIFSSVGKPVSQTIQELNQGVRLWKLFIIFVLIFLAAETILLRLLK